MTHAATTLTCSGALAVNHIRNRLVRESYPRTQMALIVALTGGFGLLASFTMLHLGVDSMTLRYPVGRFQKPPLQP